MSAHISRSSAQALLNRAIVGLLMSAAINKPANAQFWRGSINALQGLLDSDGPDFSADKDAASGAYQPPAFLKAAWAALPNSIERLPFAEVQQFLAAQGVEVTTDFVANGQIDAVLQLEKNEITAVGLSDKHAPCVVDVGNGSEHVQASCGSAIVSERPANDPPLCINCAYYTPRKNDFPACGHPEAPYEVVTGTPITSCEVNRRLDTACGHEGRRYLASTKPVKGFAA